MTGMFPEKMILTKFVLDTCVIAEVLDVRFHNPFTWEIVKELGGTHVFSWSFPRKRASSWLNVHIGCVDFSFATTAGSPLSRG